MAENSAIQWCDHTCNFWWGCHKVSPGCSNCYAETLSNRYGKSNVWGPAKTTDRELKKGIWKELPRWNRKAEQSGQRKRVFVQSMSDFFEDHPQVEEWRKEAIDLIWDCENLDFQVLTKRPENIVSMVPYEWFHFGWPSNVWIGTSVENQETADQRIPELLKIPAKIRFLSCEPLLEPIDLWPWLHSMGAPMQKIVNGRSVPGVFTPFHWIIVGGESGRKARPMHMEWVYDIVEQCKTAGVACFVKQMGDNPYYAGDRVDWLGKKGHNIEKWPTPLQVREFPQP